ncbi:response regulator [Pseudocolwellia sp. AS88]|uniref:response regulator n=1 Tax=Pseudocolwellia TaxID=2848177 RepID=UPI0026EF366D|nr:response regulator [Pseudocolwellia sp. AS88]MDO7086535.1 response regulator [Pseudocolwellia sp. AS88]
MPHSILIVEDEVKLATLLVDYFKASDYDPHQINHGDEVIAWVKEHQPKAILLDIMLPGKNGIELCKEIRQFSNVPILMITAKVDEIDRVLGLELGADDYICKPFSAREVVARVGAVLRRTQTVTNVSHALVLDEHRITVSFQQQNTVLTSVEFQLLKMLADKPDRIFSRDQLMQNMYSDSRIVNHRTIDSHIKKLRKKLAEISEGKDWIESVYGVGYRLVN